MQEPNPIVEEADKNLKIFELEKSLNEQAESYEGLLNEKDKEFTKVGMHICIGMYHVHTLLQREIPWYITITHKN